MKYQFQFAGANVAGPKPPQRRRLRMGVLLAVIAVVTLAYGYHLFNTMHGHPATANHARSAAPAAAPKPVTAATKAMAATTITAPVTAPVTPADSHAPLTASPSVAGSRMETMETAQVAPVATPHSPVAVINSTRPPPEAGAAGASIAAARVAARPVAPHWQPLTAAQRLARAGEVAMENMLIKATKYPGSYGFRVEDQFEKAKLGQAIPVYTISESDRAKYQPGQRVKPLLKATGKWMFPVLSGDHVCCMVSVKYEDHEYVPGESSKALGEAWSVISEKWPADAGFHPQLVVYSSMPGYYFTVPELPVPNVTDTVKMTMFQPAVSPADVILASWR